MPPMSNPSTPSVSRLTNGSSRARAIACSRSRTCVSRSASTTLATGEFVPFNGVDATTKPRPARYSASAANVTGDS